MKAWRHTLKILLPLAPFAAGFTLISLGVGEIFGLWWGVISAGITLVLLGAPIIRT